MDKQKKIFGVIGDPVKHSLSPAMHNAAFQHLKLNAEYQLFHIKKHELEDFFKRMVSGEIWGINVTLPHKEHVHKYLDQITPLAKEIGAVNLVIHDNGQLIGDNTDGPGYLSSLIHETHFDSKHENIVVIGAGGASKAICHLLCDNGASNLSIINRSLDRANKMINDLKQHHPKTTFLCCALDQIDKKILNNAHLLINATSLGLEGNPWPSLDFLNELNPKAIVSDIVYTPHKTQFLAAAEHNGHTLHFGDSMLLYQGVISFERFTKQKAPIDVMKTALNKALQL